MPPLKRKSSATRSKMAKDGMKRLRGNLDYKVRSQRVNKQCQEKRLQNPKNKELHNGRLIVNQRKRMLNLTTRDAHRLKLKKCQEKRLYDPIKRKAHRKRVMECQRKRLDYVKQSMLHKEGMKVNQEKRLLDPIKRMEHRRRLIVSQQRRFQNEERRIKHNMKLKINQMRRLNNLTNRTLHRIRLTISQRKRMARRKFRTAHSKRCLNNYHYQKMVKMQRTNNKSITKYFNNIKKGPSNECVCCGRLWFEKSLTYYSFQQLLTKKITKDFLVKVCPGFEDETNVGYLCCTCKKHVLQQKIPPLSLCHEELRFPVISDTLKNMSALEERFVAPRIPFMRIQTLNHAGQFAIHGKVVNVPIDVPSSVNILPRLPQETDVISIALKKKKSYKSNYLFESVRPNVVLKAIDELKDSDVYRAANITVDLNRIDTLVESHNAMLNDINLQNNDGVEIESNHRPENTEIDTDGLEPLNVPSEETLLQPNAIVFAPGEGNKPLPVLLDEHAESMSFIKIYGGNLRKIPDAMSYQEWVKSEITRKDRRCCSLPKIFYSASKIRYQMVTNKISFCLRKTKHKPHYTAGQLLDENILKDVELHDSGYKVFASDRGSPSFWESKKKEVFAMLRQLGPPTFFLTLSAAETRWPELIVLLKRVLDGIDISEEEAIELSFQEKCRLIQQDPVTCSRYFDYKVRQLFSLMKTTDVVFEADNKILDYYIRTEFQQRGSPHVHCLIWLKNSPQFNPDSNDNHECCSFVDKYITCSNTSDDEPLSYQTHKHSSTCKKLTKSGIVCRFSFPLYPMKNTTILNPLEDEIDEQERAQLKENVKAINSLLQDLVKGAHNVTFDEFLNKLNMTEDVYIKTIRYKIKRTMVCLKRQPYEIMVNQYNCNILQLHRANMDIQFITDKYSLVNYVLNYVNKSSRGVSKAMSDAMDEVKGGNFTIREKLKHLANKFLNASEFSAQEAIYFILSMPLSKCSRSSVFINTNRPEQRISVVKSKKELMQMEEESTDVIAMNLLDYYVNRPDKLEKTCLAEFAANFNFSKTERPATRNRKLSNDEDDQSEEEKEDAICKSFKLKGNLGFVKERQKSKIIRYVNFNKEQNETEHFREQAMLFLPWRDETNELLIVDASMIYQENVLLISVNRSKFVFSHSYDTAQLNNMAQQVVRNYSTEEQDEIMNVENEFAILDDRVDEGDLEMSDQGNPKKEKEPAEVFPIPYLIPEDKYVLNMRNLNEYQRKYLLHILHLLKQDVNGLCECVLGGAGVGKSMLIECIQQSIIRYYNSIPGNTISDFRVLLSAPTGKAAYGIKGITLHSAFVLPLNQVSGEMLPLSSSTSNTLLASMSKVKLIIIDEISMVGSRMLGHIDTRLRQIFKEDLPFGNQNIILFGDFNQLPPVGDKFIFQTVTDNPYSTLIGNPLWSLFRGYLLTEIMRQKEDALFAAALNRLAEGKLNYEDIQLFRSRVNSSITHPSISEAIHLFRSNYEVDLFNNSVIQKSGNEIVESKADDTILGTHSEKVKGSVLKQIKNLRTQDTYGLPSTLKMALDIKYMLTNNVNVKDGLVNGAVGQLKMIEKVRDKITRVWLKFDDPGVGRNTRSTVATISNAKANSSEWTPIDKMKRNITLRKCTKINVIRDQLPLVPAEALTIYKSQGSTYKQVHVHLSKGLKRNELYVACSRATSIQGLTFDGNFNAPAPPSSHDPVPYHVKEMLQSRPVRLSITYLQDIKCAEMTFLFHNIQSLNKHLKDMIVDRCAISADLLILVETWTNSNDVIEIPSHKVIFNTLSGQGIRKPYGITIFQKHEFLSDCSVVFQHNVDAEKGRCNMVCFVCSSYCFCILYKPPSTSFSKIQNELKTMLELAVGTNKKIIVLGDFNIDYITKRSHPCFEMMNNFNLRLNVPQNCNSNNGKSQIDLCFTSCDNIQTNYYESYFSYHKPIVGIISKESGAKESDKYGHNVSDEKKTLQIYDENTNAHTFQHDGENEQTVITTPDLHIGKIQSIRTPGGFRNIDGVSCYCNSVAQSLFINRDMLQKIITDEPESPLGTLAMEYASNKDSNVMDSKPLRIYIDFVLEHNVYSQNRQQDVSEFLTHLTEVSQSVGEFVAHKYSVTRKCTNCHFEHDSSSSNRLLGLEVPEHNRTTSINELFNNQFNCWKSIGNSMCTECGQWCEKEEKCIISEPNELLIFQLGLWKVLNNQVKKKTAKIKNATKDELTIAGVKYKVMSAIFHHGQSVKSGHYTAMLRIGGNNWVKADDERVIQSTWPRYSKNVYVFICKRQL